jgi:hypothetical protein
MVSLQDLNDIIAAVKQLGSDPEYIVVSPETVKQVRIARLYGIYRIPRRKLRKYALRKRQKAIQCDRRRILKQMRQVYEQSNQASD